MIEFITVYLGLVAGLQPVEVRVGPGVASVELRLDGAPATEIAHPPWRADLDLGPELAPHELEAIARDGAGRTLGTSIQGINLPDGQAGARIALERGPDGRPVAAAVTWNRALAAEAVHLFLDGAELSEGRAGPPPARLSLPAVDPAATHVLVAELTFRGNARSTAVVAFGALPGDGETAELTAVGVASSAGDGPPAREAVADALRLDGRPQRPLAVRAGGGDVVVVLDAGSDDALGSLLAELKRRLEPADLEPAPRPPEPPGIPGASYRVARLWAQADEVAEDPEATSDLFSTSSLYVLGDSGLSSLMARYDPPPIPERIADAVCVAGSLAVAARRPRAVVLVTDPATVDGSLFAAAAARSYLVRLGVPLLVWTAADDPGELTTKWGEVTRVAGRDALAVALDRLRAVLAAQAVAWLPGRHPPGAVSVAGGAGSSVILAGDGLGVGSTLAGAPAP